MPLSRGRMRSSWGGHSALPDIIMTRKSILGLALVYFLLLWAVFTWPLAKYVFTGIPSSATNVEKDNVIRMVPGDHLQLHYNFWLAKDMLSGDTPLFHNIYEFNTGSDRERFLPRPYYAPASLFYALIARFGGNAFAWNVSGLLCLLIGFWASWRLARRFVSDEATALFMGALGQLVPFSWVSLLGGSPAGFGFVWVAVLFLGIDMAIRDRRIRGGFLAGLAILFASWTDSHVFFFLMLATPCWCLLSFALRDSVDLRSGKNWRELTLALLPAVGLAIIAYVLFSLEHANMLGGTTMEEGRSASEVLLFSPAWQGLFSFSHDRAGALIYIGYALVTVLGLGFVSLMLRPPEMSIPPWRVRLFVVVLFCSMAVISILALGLSGPKMGAVFLRLRELIPPYAMIRQPPKIFCLMPSLLSIAAALSVASLVAWIRPLYYRRMALGALALILTLSLKWPVAATICLLDNGNEAYRAIATDAAQGGKAPQVLGIPLWPGDSSWSSLNEHYASLYRIRMVNGYSPFVKSNYVEDVFYPLDSINKGALSESQISDLRAMGVGYIVLHENAFPEKVSPYPVAFTLSRFLNHPRLELMHQSGEVWAFRILPRPRQVTPSVNHWQVFGPSRRWDLSLCPRGGVQVVDDPSTWQGRYVQLSHTNAWIKTDYPPRVVGAPDQRWMLRVRGEGEFRSTLNVQKPLAAGPLRAVAAYTTRVDSAEWSWCELPVEFDPDNEELSLRLEHVTGQLDMDMLMLAAGPWAAPSPGQPTSIPASCFFHAGYSDLRNGCVVLRPDREPDRAVFYGPRMPLETGEHQLEFVFTSAAPALTRLGRLELYMGWEQVAEIDVLAGRPANVSFTVEQNLPFGLKFVYSREAQVCLHRAILSRKDAPSAE